MYQPGLLFVPFGLTHAEDIVRPRQRQLHDGIAFVESAIDRVDIDANDGAPRRRHDARLRRAGRRHRRRSWSPRRPRVSPGRAGWRRSSPSTRPRVRPRSAPRWRPSTAAGVVVNVVDMPIKCPVAPLEFCFLADWYFHERGIRDRVELTYVTPLDGAFTKPVASEHLGGMLAERGIELVTEFNTGEVDGAGGRLSATTAARSRSTWRSSSRCTAAPPTSAARRGSATSSTSCPPTSTRCRRRRRRTSS